MCLMLDQFLWGDSSRVCDISCFHPKSFISCPKIKIDLPLKYIVLVAIYILIPGYYRKHGNKCQFSL